MSNTETLSADDLAAVSELLKVAEAVRDDLMTDYIAQHSVRATRNRTRHEAALDGAIPKVRAILKRFGVQ